MMDITDWPFQKKPPLSTSTSGCTFPSGPGYRPANSVRLCGICPLVSGLQWLLGLADDTGVPLAGWKLPIVYHHPRESLTMIRPSLLLIAVPVL